MWKRDLEPGTYTFDQAVSHVSHTRDAGFSDWRLPTIDELTTLVEKCRRSPALNNDIFNSSTDSFVWSGSSDEGDSRLAWYVYFAQGKALSNGRSFSNSARLVRNWRLADVLSETQTAAANVALKAQALRWRVIDQRRSQSISGQGATPDLSVGLERALQSVYFTARGETYRIARAGPLESQEPREADFQHPLTIRERGEFETTATYEARKRDAQAAHEASVKQAYVSAMQVYQAAQRTNQEDMTRQRQAQAAFEARMETPAGWAPLLDEAWKEVVAKHLGDPILTDVSYDADRQVFNATLRSSMGTFSKPVAVPVPIDRAPAMKADLLSGKIAPTVTLRFPGPEVTWELVENDALRKQRFNEANNSIAQLESLIAEYPQSAEAKLARTRIFQVPSTSKELIAVTSRLSSWPEASTGRARLREVQMAEWKAAEAMNTSSSYKNFIDNFAGGDSQGLLARARSARQTAEANEAARERRAEAERREADARYERDRPRREAEEANRRNCENLRQSCIAQCPPPAQGFKLDSSARNHCLFRCDEIKCN